MSTKKTFRSQFNKVLEVDTYEDGSLSIGLGENEEPPFLARYHFDPAIAPALALAILEAAGIEPRTHCTVTIGAPEQLERITADLAQYIKFRDAAAEREAEEAAALEKLKGMARKLYNADRSACDLIWEDLSPNGKQRWVEHMRKAQDLIELEDKAQSNGD